MKQIYLDNAATTPLDKSILEKMLPYFSEKYGNPSSLHQKGREAKEALDVSRQAVAKVLNAEAEEIIFTASGTESDNLALLGIAKAYRSFGNHIIISKIEHKAVLESAKKLEEEGFEVTYVNVDGDGIVNIKEFKKALKKETILISIMYANNEVGTIQPLQKIAKIILNHREQNERSVIPFFHTDACQAVGSCVVDVKQLGVDLLTCNSSKIYGPKGIACLYRKNGIKLNQQVVGGEQEWGLRAGSEAVPLIVGFAESMVLAEKNRVKESKRLTELRNYFISQLFKAIPISKLNGHSQMRLPNNVNISIPEIEGESIVLMLDKYGIYTSTGSACAARDLNPSHVLLAIGLSPEEAHGTVRFTMGKYTTKEDLEFVVKVMPDIVWKLQRISSLSPSFVSISSKI